MTGTFSRNTEPHQNSSSSAPPRSGPAAAPADRLAAHTPMAVRRWPGSANMVRISDRVEGISVAPATPSRARAAISIGALVESAARTDTAAKAAPPISSTRRRPIRSPSVPMVTSAPAIRKPYASVIHSTCEAVG